MSFDSVPDASDLSRRALHGLFVLLLVGAALLATHEGEFWPYSVYPMFSVAGRAWDRVIVRDVTESTEVERWRTVPVEALPGTAIGLEDYGVGQNDLADFVKLTRSWDDARVQALRTVLARVTLRHSPLVYRVHGDVDAEGRASTRATPLVWLGPGLGVLHPALPVLGEAVP